MFSLESASPADFTPLLNGEFELPGHSPDGPLRLFAVDLLGPGHPGRKEPFVLRFQGPAALRLPQSIYALQHAELGTLEVFLVQNGADAAGSYFEAVFN